MANIGEQLLQPESGWQRIDDKNTNIIYNGTFSDGTGSEGTYNLTHHAIQPNDFTSNVEFYFYGTKLRIVGQTLNNRSKVINITIDDIHETYSNYVNAITGDAINCILQYEKLNLEKRIHKVTIQNDSSQPDTYVVFDAVDIDSDGYMLYRDNNGKLYYDVTPIMTSNTEPAPYVVSASSEYYPAYYAFDGTTKTNFDTNNTDKGWVSLYFGKKTKVDSFYVINRNGGDSNDASRAMKDFEILGSNSDSDYKILKSFKNEINWKGGEIRFYNLNNVFNNSYYKINCSQNNGSSTDWMFSELRYLLSVDTPFYLFKDNTSGKIYNYDEENNKLIEVNDSSILKAEAIENTCIYDLNKVIPLLDTLSDDLTILCSNDKNKLIAEGLKQNKILVIAKRAFSTRLAKNIDFFELDSDITNTSTIKLAVSTDDGVTWNVYDAINNEFIELNNTCPLKEYSTLDEEEKSQWDTFKDEVFEKGIDFTELENIDFNSIKTENMMFAYVLNRHDYEDKCEMSKLQFQFDAKGNFILLGTDGVDIKQNSENISISPKKEMELMKVNIGSSGNIIIGSDEEIPVVEPATSQDIQQILEEW